ncbi:MAG TPA: ATP-binding protein [Candidatus Gastranaerophilales bacterium]|nr:ATP-binding protein [Candidatus Gastranaerophilales bacterium]
MANLLKYIDKQDDNDFLNLNSQSKIIIFVSILSSALIVGVAWFVINNTQQTILQSYRNFGSMLAKTFAIEAVDFIKNCDDVENRIKLKKHAENIIAQSEDISTIVYMNNKGEVLLSETSVNKSYNNQNKADIKVSQPLTIELNGEKLVIGSIQLDLTGHTMNIVGKATRNLMIAVFTIAWLLSIAAVFINTMLITRQIKLLSEGVKKISSGEFGYKIKSKDLWGDIKRLFESFNNMSVKLRQYEEKNIDQLTYERNKLEAVLMSIANGVIVCDRTDTVVLANNAGLDMLKMKAKQLISTKITEFYDTNGNLCFIEKVKEFKDKPYENNESRNLECQVQIDKKILKTIISPLFTIYNEYLGYVIVLHDITKEAEIDKMKNAFISNVSHELRTPVTVIRSYIDTLCNYEEEFDEKTKREFISVIDQESSRLNRMVNDILDFSRLEAPNIKLEKALCEIKPILELSISSMKVIAEERNITFSIITEPDLPKVFINAESIERALKNLLSNSIKYSHENGRVKLRAEIDRTGNYLQVSIEDNGVGIPKEHLDKIFDRFYRVENKVHSVKGTGLGLHLVKITIEKHHDGEVFVESKPGEGSAFGFKLPLNAELAVSIEDKNKISGEEIIN